VKRLTLATFQDAAALQTSLCGPGLAPRNCRSQLCLEEASHLARLGESLQQCLIEHHASVSGNPEHALAAGKQFDPYNDGGPPLQDLGRRTDGRVQIVSRNAVFDRHSVVWVDHLQKVELAGRAPASTRQSKSSCLAKETPMGIQTLLML
jgi:hypothetical protein